jgi:hypothetical protein
MSTTERRGEYDALLASIPLPLVVGGLSSLLLTVPQALALSLGSLGSAGLIGYSLFFNPPQRA